MANESEKRQACTEGELTPAMIDAGASTIEYFRIDRDDPLDSPDPANDSEGVPGGYSARYRPRSS